jgi:hypothetical protein
VREGEHWFADDGSPAARVVLRIPAPGSLAGGGASSILTPVLDDE